MENFMSDEERELVDSTEDLIYIDRLVSNEDKARIEALLSDEEFLELMELKHGTSKGLNRAVNLSTGLVIQQEVMETIAQNKK